MKFQEKEKTYTLVMAFMKKWRDKFLEKVDYILKVKIFIQYLYILNFTEDKSCMPSILNYLLISKVSVQ